MSALLLLKTSIFSDAGESSRLADEFARSWLKARADGRVIVRDLALNPIPHLTAERFQALLRKPEERTPEQREVVELSDTLIRELKDADEIAFAVPTYNFGIPSQLKAYFDHIARAGVTFRYTEAGPVGLLPNRKVYIFAARGGFYAGTALDSASRYLQDFLAFLGLSDVEFVYAEGLSIGPDRKETALREARRRIAELVAPGRAATAA